MDDFIHMLLFMKFFLNQHFEKKKLERIFK